jgi:hypothetical protein
MLDKEIKSKKVHAELNNRLSTRFDHIKSSLGIQNDAEVIRFLIQYYYNKEFEPKETFVKGTDPKEDAKIIKRIAERYGEALKRLGED